MLQTDNTQTVTTANLNAAINARRSRFSNTLCVKITSCQRQGLDTAADDQGLTLSEFSRSIVDEYLEEYFRNKKL